MPIEDQAKAHLIAYFRHIMVTEQYTEAELIEMVKQAAEQEKRES